MTAITITGFPATTCGHHTIQTDKGNLLIHASDLSGLVEPNFDDMKNAFLICLKDRYMDLRIGPPAKTHAAALAALVGEVVRI